MKVAVAVALKQFYVGVAFLISRPNVDQILKDDFMMQGYLPSRLPLSCLTMPPRFDVRLNNSIVARRALGEVNQNSPVIAENQGRSGSML